MPAEIQPEDLQVAANQVISQLLNDNIALRATVEAQDRALSSSEQEVSRLRKLMPETESPNGKAEEVEVVP